MSGKFLKEALLYIIDYPRYLYGLWNLWRLKQPIVTIFGGKRVDTTNPYYQQALQLAGMLVKEGISVLTGGGPGIMEAALCGATRPEFPLQSLGIGVRGVDVDFISACDQRVIFLGDFADRKKLLIDYSSGFIVFPGGIGTLDEVTEVINLMKTKKIKSVPIILIGTAYWKSFLDWFSLALQKGFIAQEHADIFVITDDIQHAFATLRKRI